MGSNINTKGLWYGYDTIVDVKTKTHLLSITDNGNIEYELNSNDKPTPARCKVTMYNIRNDYINQIHKGDHITVRSGPKDLFGIVAEGNIIKIETNNDSGKDKSIVITFVESESLKNVGLKSNFNGVKTVKTKGKHPKTKLSMSFKGEQRAKTIIQKAAKASGIKIYHLKLAKNKIYKRGYVINDHAYSAITKIAKDCDSQLYQRRGKLVIDDFSTDNPYKEHIYFELGAGLLAEPSVYDKYGKKQCFILECFDDPRVQAGSSIQVHSKTLNGLHRVQSVKHTHQGNYEMEVVVYE